MSDDSQPSTHGTSPSLALCMIVRDEGDRLAACLSSIAAHVDRICVTDTGSSDNSIEIARSFGAEIREFPWSDDFSAARNASIANIPEDWILILDADDRFPEGEAQRIRPLLAEADVDSWTFDYHLMPNHTPAPGRKLFRNRPGLRFEGIIHEHLRNALESIGGTTRHAPIQLIHTGYSEENRLAKIARNLPLLKREFERAQQAGDRRQTAYVGKELALALAFTDEAANAVRLLTDLLHERSGKTDSAGTDWEVTLVTSLIWLLLREGRETESWDLCTRHANRFGNHPLFRLYRAICALGINRFAEALEDLESFEAFTRGNRLPFSIPSGYTKQELWNIQAQCHLGLGNPDRAADCLRRCIAVAPENREYQARLRIAIARARPHASSQPDSSLPDPSGIDS